MKKGDLAAARKPARRAHTAVLVTLSVALRCIPNRWECITAQGVKIRNFTVSFFKRVGQRSLQGGTGTGHFLPSSAAMPQNCVGAKTRADYCSQTGAAAMMMHRCLNYGRIYTFGYFLKDRPIHVPHEAHPASVAACTFTVRATSSAVRRAISARVVR